MIYLLTVFIVFCLVALTYSIIYYLRAPISNPLKNIFLAVRVLLIVLFIICFLEPVIKYQRLAPEKPVIPVLIDASASMRLFKSDSIVIPLLKKLHSLNSKDKRIPFFDFYLFGDTLRKLNSISNIKFDDFQSKYPEIPSNLSRSAQNVIVISDANWSGKTSQLDKFSDRSVFYLPLPAPKTRPYLQITVHDSLDTTNSTSANLKIIIDGFSSKQGQLLISVFEQSQNIYKRQISVNPGIISTPITIALPKQKPGKHLYRIIATLESDSLHSEEYFLNYIQPRTFTYSIYNKQSTLNNRFFSLALQRHPEFIKNAYLRNATDLQIYFSNPPQISETVKSLSINGILAFLGCSPCSETELISTPQNFQFIQPVNYPETPMSKLSITELPPPSYLYLCNKNNFAIQHLISATYTINKESFTAPILYTGNLKRHRFISLSAVDFWRWDFLTLSNSNGNEESFPFSEKLIATIKEMLLSKIGGDFFAFPILSMQKPDSFTFALSLPSDLTIPEEIGVKISIRNLNTPTHFDTSLKITSTGSLLQYLKTKALQPGDYQYRFEINSASGGIYTYSDSLYINEDIAEYHVQAQNTELLDDFAQAIRFDSDSSINRFLQNVRSAPRTPIQEQFQITRSWILLAFIFLLFTLEWALRKKFDLD